MPPDADADIDMVTPDMSRKRKLPASPSCRGTSSAGKRQVTMKRPACAPPKYPATAHIIKKNQIVPLTAQERLDTLPPTCDFMEVFSPPRVGTWLSNIGHLFALGSDRHLSPLCLRAPYRLTSSAAPFIHKSMRNQRGHLAPDSNGSGIASSGLGLRSTSHTAGARDIGCKVDPTATQMSNPPEA